MGGGRKTRAKGILDRLLVKLLGWHAIMLRGDPTVCDRWRWLKRHLIAGPLRTLDAGCGAGAFTMYASILGNEAVGLSFSEKDNLVARKRATDLHISGVEFLQVDLRELDKSDDRLGLFDQIICLETIEHIRDDEKLLADLSRLLYPGGRLLLTTPFKHHRALLDDAVSDQEDGGHVRWGYTHEEMRRLFDKYGLDVTAEEYVSGLFSQQICNLVRLFGRANSKLALGVTMPLRILQFIDGPVTRLVRYPQLSIGVVGIKRV